MIQLPGLRTRERLSSDILSLRFATMVLCSIVYLKKLIVRQGFTMHKTIKLLLFLGVTVGGMGVSHAMERREQDGNGREGDQLLQELRQVDFKKFGDEVDRLKGELERLQGFLCAIAFQVTGADGPVEYGNETVDQISRKIGELLAYTARAPESDALRIRDEEEGEESNLVEKVYVEKGYVDKLLRENEKLKARWATLLTSGEMGADEIMGILFHGIRKAMVDFERDVTAVTRAFNQTIYSRDDDALCYSPKKGFKKKRGKKKLNYSFYGAAFKIPDYSFGTLKRKLGEIGTLLLELQGCVSKSKNSNFKELLLRKIGKLQIVNDQVKEIRTKIFGKEEAAYRKFNALIKHFGTNSRISFNRMIAAFTKQLSRKNFSPPQRKKKKKKKKEKIKKNGYREL